MSFNKKKNDTYKKKNDTYKKTTLDRRHKEKLLDFEMNDNKLGNLKKNLDKINKRMIEINNIDYIDIYQTSFLRKRILIIKSF